MKMVDSAVLWARVSTKEQGEEGFSLDAQIRLLRDYAEKNSLKIVKEFTVPESARSSQERKEFKKMIDFLKANPKVKHIISEKVDRVTRNPKDSVILDDWLHGRD